ncbi:MAG: tetratricopeptide repeat protein, partial [Alistipes sp.]|nr:tetratricopeptide repeat protein [Alistipes sp.]
SLAIEEEKFTRDLDDAGLYKYISSIFYNKGEYDNALKYRLKAVAIEEQILGVEHIETAQSYGLVGIFYNNLGEHLQALEYNLKAIEIYEKKLGKDHPYTQQTRENVSLAKEKMNTNRAFKSDNSVSGESASAGFWSKLKRKLGL